MEEINLFKKLMFNNESEPNKKNFKKSAALNFIKMGKFILENTKFRKEQTLHKKNGVYLLTSKQVMEITYVQK